MARHVQTPAGLLVPEHVASAAAFAEPRPPAGEVATTADGRDITRGYVDALDLLTPQDTVLAGKGADLRLYEELLRDDQVAACFAQRRLAVISAEWEVEPGGEKRIDKKAAESLKAQLAEVGWDRVTTGMLHAVMYGYSVAECLWGRDGAEVVLDDLKVRKARRFAFAPDMTLRLLTSKNVRGEPLPERKFWVVANGADNDDEPYGLGLGHQLYWPVWFKRNGTRFWLVYLEKFGMPTGLGKFPSNATPEERNRLLAAVRAIRGDSGVIVPEGMMVELLEAARSGTADYSTLCERMDAAIAKVLLGQTASSQGTPGRLGNDELQSDVRADIVKADADLICGSFNRTVARWLTEWNYPGAAVPRVWRQLDEPEDLNTTAERDERLHAIGWQRTEESHRDTYGDGYERVEPPEPPPPVPGQPPQPGQPAPGTDPAEFAEGADDDPAPTDPIAAQLEREAADPLRGWLDQVREFAEQAESLEALRDRLLGAYADLPTAQLADVMSLAFAAADGAGRLDAAGEAGLLEEGDGGA